jgi:hypothetical protein
VFLGAEDGKDRTLLLALAPVAVAEKEARIADVKGCDIGWRA